MKFYSNLTIFYQNRSYTWGKLTSFVIVLAQNTRVYGCRPVLYYIIENIGLLDRFTKHGMGIMDTFLL